MGSIYLLLVFVVIDTIKDAGMVLALAGIGGGPGGKVTVPALFMLRKAFVEQEMGYACAVGIVLAVIVMSLQKLLTLAMNWHTPALLSRRHLHPAAGLVLLPVPCFGPADERAARRVQRHSQPGYRLRRRLLDAALRTLRHLAIWTVLALAFLPLYLMLIVSFKSNKQFYEHPAAVTFPLHPENWASAWAMVTPTVANSVFISCSATALTLVLALTAAYFFARLRLPLSGLLWNGIIVLMMLPMIANLVPLFRLLVDLKLLNTLSALILVGAASSEVFAIFVLRSFVADIPPELYEAAEIDGANHFQQLRHVVLPLSGPILGTVGVMAFIASWNDFVMPLIIVQDRARLPVTVQLLRLAGEYIKYWGPLMAGYAMASIPIILLFVFAMKLFVRGLTEGAVKG
jgi:ABC-type glycerol-3-phosphate transport system permease component